MQVLMLRACRETCEHVLANVSNSYTSRTHEWAGCPWRRQARRPPDRGDRVHVLLDAITEAVASISFREAPRWVSSGVALLACRQVMHAETLNSSICFGVNLAATDEYYFFCRALHWPCSIHSSCWPGRARLACGGCSATGDHCPVCNAAAPPLSCSTSPACANQCQLATRTRSQHAQC